jgi:hypothetical protein
VHSGRFTPEFVVEIDHVPVSRARTTVIRALYGSAWAGLVGGGLIIGIVLAPGFAIGFAPDSWSLLFMAVPD